MESAIDGEINNGERFRVETGYKIIKIFSKFSSKFSVNLYHCDLKKQEDLRNSLVLLGVTPV